MPPGMKDVFSDTLNPVLIIECDKQIGTTQGKVARAQKDIHQHREESSRARGMLASRAKSESFVWRGPERRNKEHKEKEKDDAKQRISGRDDHIVNKIHHQISAQKSNHKIPKTRIQ